MPANGRDLFGFRPDRAVQKMSTRKGDKNEF